MSMSCNIVNVYSYVKDISYFSDFSYQTMASSSSDKPFAPEVAYRTVHELQQPAVFMNMTKDWPVLQWTAEHLSNCLQDKPIRFRLGKKEETNRPLFETQCSYVNATLVHFLRWTQDLTGENIGPFSDFPISEYWAYADYKYIAEMFEDQPSMFEDVKWSEFGFEGRNGRESTLWIGAEGANTPCHLDSYGCNLVLQVQGRKRWHLFPPEDTSKLYPTRIPYEESSVFSRVDILNPDLNEYSDFRRARAHCVTLQPGQVLFVPRHWWHYVESVDPVTVSVNSWIELEVDDVARISEAVTKAVVCAFKTTQSEDNMDDWLNPTEEGVTSHTENMQYVNLALRSFSQRHGCLSSSSFSKTSHLPRHVHPVKRDSTGHVLTHDTAPFGPNLIPVHCQQSPPPPAPRTATNETNKYVRKCATQCSEPSQQTDTVMGIHQGTGLCGSALSCTGVCGCGERVKEDISEKTVSTNDLLDCLVHPNVIKLVTELLIQRCTGIQNSGQESVGEKLK